MTSLNKLSQLVEVRNHLSIIINNRNIINKNDIKELQLIQSSMDTLFVEHIKLLNVENELNEVDLEFQAEIRKVSSLMREEPTEKESKDIKNALVKLESKDVKVPIKKITKEKSIKASDDRVIEKEITNLDNVSENDFTDACIGMDKAERTEAKSVSVDEQDNEDIASSLAAAKLKLKNKNTEKSHSVSVTGGKALSENTSKKTPVKKVIKKNVVK